MFEIEFRTVITPPHPPPFKFTLYGYIRLVLCDGLPGRLTFVQNMALPIWCCTARIAQGSIVFVLFGFSLSNVVYVHVSICFHLEPFRRFLINPTSSDILPQETG